MSHIRRATTAFAALMTIAAAIAAPGAAEPAGAPEPAQQRAASVIAAGNHHVCTIVRGGNVTCWGDNWAGQLGLGDDETRGDDSDEMGDDLPIVDLGTGRTAVAVSAGANHTCAILDTGTVKCWGNGFSGRLGYGDGDNRGDDLDEMGDDLPVVDLGTGRTAVTISSGDAHNCVILDNADLKCWGHNSDGRLGYGDDEHRGDDPDEMGDDLPVVDLGTGRTATAIALGEDHTCAVLDNGAVKCWGYNSSEGQLGAGDTDYRGSDADEMGDDLAPVDLGTGRTAKAITAGRDHVCAILDDDTIKCWGDNSRGTLGLGDSDDRGADPTDMGGALPAVDLGGERTPIAIAAGESHTCVLFDDRSVKCWGENNGKLGLGHTDDHGDGVGPMGDDLPLVDFGDRTPVSLGLGRDNTCALFSDETLACLGTNSDGESGVGTDAVLGDDPEDMGDDLQLVDLGHRIRPIQVACPTSPHHGFPDLPGSSYADPHVTCMKELAITTGTDGGTLYSPADYVTREQMAAFLARVWRALDQTCATTPHHGFPDVAATSFADDDVTCIKELAITTGTNGGTLYSPADYVTREQMAAFLGRLWEALGNECPTTPHHGFPDVAATSFAERFITCIKELGITTGTNGGTLYSPADYVTREQMAAFIGRLIHANRNV